MKVLKKIGLARVSSLGIKINYSDLVSEKRPTGYSNYKATDGYFIITHSSTEQKREILEKISGILGVRMSVDVVSPTQS